MLRSSDTTSSHLQNEPLHDPQKVQDGHNAAEKHHDGQGLREENPDLLRELHSVII